MIDRESEREGDRYGKREIWGERERERESEKEKQMRLDRKIWKDQNQYIDSYE